jgi:hypothetical protein
LLVPAAMLLLLLALLLLVLPLWPGSRFARCHSCTGEVMPRRLDLLLEVSQLTVSDGQVLLCSVTSKALFVFFLAALRRASQ